MVKADNISYRTQESSAPGDLMTLLAPGGLKKSYLLTKRGLDLTCSILIIGGILSWLLPVMAILIRLDSRGPASENDMRITKVGKFLRATHVDEAGLDFQTLFSRYQWDSFYVRNASTLFDFRIIRSTTRLFFTQKIGLWR